MVHWGHSQARPWDDVTRRDSDCFWSRRLDSSLLRTMPCFLQMCGISSDPFLSVLLFSLPWISVEGTRAQAEILLLFLINSTQCQRKEPSKHELSFPSVASHLHSASHLATKKCCVGTEGGRTMLAWHAPDPGLISSTTQRGGRMCTCPTWRPKQDWVWMSSSVALCLITQGLGFCLFVFDLFWFL